MNVRAADSAAPASLIPNGGFEADKNSVGWPDGWVRAKGGVTWLAENGNHFLHLAAGRPGEVVMLYQPVTIPAGVAALELTWRQRVTGLRALPQMM